MVAGRTPLSCCEPLLLPLLGVPLSSAPLPQRPQSHFLRRWPITLPPDLPASHLRFPFHGQQPLSSSSKERGRWTGPCDSFLGLPLAQATSVPVSCAEVWLT